MKNKTVAAWLAFVGGPLGLHRFYLHGLSDMIGWLLPIPTALGLYGIQRVQALGQDDHYSWVLIPLLGFTIAGCALQAILYGLMAPEKWNDRFNPAAAPDAPAGRTRWATIFAIGLALMIGVATLGSSAKASVRDLIGESFVGDYIIVQKQQQSLVGLPPDMIAEIEAADVGDVLVIGITTVLAGDKLDNTQVVTIDPETAGELFTFDFVSGGFGSLTPNGVLLQDSRARSFGVDVGDTLPVKLLDGTTVQAEVQGIYTTKGWTSMLLDRELFAGENRLQAPDLQMYVKATDGESKAVTQQLQDIMKRYPIAKVQTRSEFIASQDDAINTFLTFIFILLAMSIFIAVVGIVITLWLSVWERRRELGLLRAVGTTRRQVRSSVLWESLITGVVGIVMGVVLGLALGWIIWKTFEDDGLSVFELPTTTVIWTAVGSLVLAALASVLPARKAAKSDILAAIATT